MTTNIKVFCLFSRFLLFFALFFLSFSSFAEEENNEIISASEIDYPPFCVVNSNGEADGFSVKLLRESLQRVGKEVLFSLGTWVEVKQMLVDGKVRVLPAVCKTAEREKIFDFTFPYMTIYSVIVVREDEKKIISLSDLEGKTVAVLKGDNIEEYFLQNGHKFNMISLPTYSKSLLDLSEGKYDAVLIQKLTASRLIDELDIKNLKILDKTLTHINQKFCFAVQKGDKEMLTLLNEGLSVALADGTYNKLHSEWFARYELPKDRPIIFGGVKQFCLSESIQKESKPDCFSVELIKKLAEIKNLNIDFYFDDWSKVIEGLKIGKIDAAYEIFFSKSRVKYFDFSTPYASINYITVQRKDAVNKINRLSDLKGLRILVSKEDLEHDFFTENNLNDILIITENTKDSLKKLSNGFGDCAIAPATSVSLIKKREQLKNLKIGTDTVFSADYCFAVRKGNKALLSELNDALQIVKDSGDFQKIQKKWFPPLVFGYNIKNILLTIILLILSLFLSVIWIKKLKSDIRRKSTEFQSLEQRYKNMFQGSRDGFVVMDKYGRFLDANESFCKMLGYSLDELKDKNFYDITPSEWHQWEKEDILEDKLLKRGWSGIYEKECIRKNGEVFPIEVEAYTHRDTKGEILYLWGMVRDISDRKRKEKEFTEKLLFERIISQIAVLAGEEDELPQFISKSLELLGRNLDISRVYLFEHGGHNETFSSTYEWCADGIKSCKEDLQNIKIPEFRKFFNYITENAVYACSDTSIISDSKTREVLEAQEIKSLIICKLNLGGKSYGFIGFDECRKKREWLPFERDIILCVADIFNTTLSKFFAKQDEHRLLVAIENSPETIVITDPEGKIEYVNNAFTKITGYSRNEAIGQFPSILKSGIHDKNFYDILWKTIKEKKVWSGQFINKRKDGSLFYEDAVISPVLNSNGGIINFVGIKRDITEKMELERQLQDSQKLESIGRLAGGVAHDFNNILSVILGFSQIAKAKLEKDHPAIYDLDEVIKAGNRASDITKQLLSFARRDFIKPKLISINDIINENLNLLKSSLPGNINFVFKPADTELQVMMDPTQIIQVIINLIVNAKDAVNGDGEIVLSTSLQEITDEESQKHSEYQKGTFALISVRDNGCGIATEILNNIFEPFFTTKPKGKGTGLGLSTIYGIVKQNNGFISVQSKLGKGTEFKIFIPIAKVDQNKAVEQAKTTDIKPDIELKNHIFVVEDEPSVLKICANLLEKSGYEVSAFTSAKEALQSAIKNPPNIILTDVIMPGMNGKVFAESILKINPSCKVLYMSGYTADFVSENVISAGQIDIIRKPFTSNELLNKIASLR